ncbi:MAG: pilus assembly protein TadG-related protein [Bacillota bacterium]
MRLSFNDQRGAAILIVAVALVALLGFGALVFDVGVLYINRERLSNAADAAALAGAQFLPDDPATAVSTAQHYAGENGVQAGELTVDVDTDDHSITVDAERQVSLSLAKVLGFASARVTGHAKAQVGGADKVLGLAPLGIPDQTLEYGRLYSLKLASDTSETGNFGALALGAPGANTYEDNLRYGYKGWLEIGDCVYTETGNISNPTVRAIDHRVSGHEDCTFNNYCLNCPRVIIIPVYDPVGELDGKSLVKIVGFAAFFLEGTTGQGVNCYVNGYFIKAFAGNARGNSGSDYGLRSIKLVE